MTPMTTPPSAPRVIPARLRVVTHERPLHLRSLSHPLSRAEAEAMFARHQLAEAFAIQCA